MEEPKYRLSRPQIYFEAGLIALILSRAVYALFHYPAGGDEFRLAALLITKGFHAIQLSDPSRHPLALFASCLFLKGFGVGQIQANLLGLVGTIWFLLIFRKLCDQVASPAVRFFVLAALATNQAFLLFTHSLKPYSLMMALMANLIYLANTERNKGNLIVFGGIFLISPLVHTVFVVACAGLLVALLLEAHGKRDVDRAKMAAVGGLCLVPAIPILLSQVAYFQGMNFGRPSPPWFSPSEVPRHMFGWNQNAWIYWAGFMLLVSVVVRIRRDRKPDLLETLLLVWVALFGGLVIALKVNLLAGRFFLWMVPLLLIWLGQQVLEKRAWRIATALCFIVAPLTARHADFTWSPQAGAEGFVKTVTQTIGPENLGCVDVVGDPIFTPSVSTLLFPRAKAAAARCLHHYLIELPITQSASEAESVFRDARNDLIFKDTWGNAFFEVRTK